MISEDINEKKYNKLNIEFNNLKKSNNEWIQSTLKLEYIINQMLNLGFIPEDHLDWIKPMLETIKIPEVSINVKNKYVPTIQDNEIIDDGDDLEQSERIDYLSDEASLFSELIGESISENLTLNRDNTIKCIIKIQSHIKRFILVKKYNLLTNGNIIQKKNSVVTIQKYFRNYKSIQKINNEIYEYFYTKYTQKSYIKKIITFVNSGLDNIEVSFINNVGITKYPFIIKGFNSDETKYNINYSKKYKCFINDKFSIVGANKNYNIRITSFHNNNNVYDVNTGLIFSEEVWINIVENKFPEYFQNYRRVFNYTPFYNRNFLSFLSSMNNNEESILQEVIFNSLLS